MSLANNCYSKLYWQMIWDKMKYNVNGKSIIYIYKDPIYNKKEQNTNAKVIHKMMSIKCREESWGSLSLMSCPTWISEVPSQIVSREYLPLSWRVLLCWSSYQISLVLYDYGQQITTCRCLRCNADSDVVSTIKTLHLQLFWSLAWLFFDNSQRLFLGNFSSGESNEVDNSFAIIYATIVDKLKEETISWQPSMYNVESFWNLGAIGMWENLLGKDDDKALKLFKE